MLSRRFASAFAVCAAALCLAVVSGCDSRTPIARLLDDPGQSEGKSVWIAGTTKNGVGVLNYGTFQVTDDTGTILVVSEKHGAPRDGAEVAVHGVFHAAFTVGSQTAAVIVEDQRKTR